MVKYTKIFPVLQLISRKKRNNMVQKLFSFQKTHRKILTAMERILKLILIMSILITELSAFSPFWASTA